MSPRPLLDPGLWLKSTYFWASTDTDPHIGASFYTISAKDASLDAIYRDNRVASVVARFSKSPIWLVDTRIGCYDDPRRERSMLGYKTKLAVAIGFQLINVPFDQFIWR
jgi:hypothetical protein